MCPLAVAPNRGYGDYQRLDNYDTGLLWQNTLTNSNINFVGNVLDVSRFAYLSGTLSETQSTSQIGLTWYSDDLAAQFMGERIVMLDSNIVAVAQIRFPNLGPFCTVGQAFVGPSHFTSTVNIFATNRVHPLEFIPQFPIVVDKQNVAIAATTSVFVFPNNYYSGPAQVGFFIGVAGSTLNFHSLAPNGVYDLIYQNNNIAASTWINVDLVFPSGAWRAQVNNTGVATSYWLTVVPSTTGAT